MLEGGITFVYKSVCTWSWTDVAMLRQTNYTMPSLSTSNEYTHATEQATTLRQCVPLCTALCHFQRGRNTKIPSPTDLTTPSKKRWVLSTSIGLEAFEYYFASTTHSNQHCITSSALHQSLEWHSWIGKRSFVITNPHPQRAIIFSNTSNLISWPVMSNR